MKLTNNNLYFFILCLLVSTICAVKGASLNAPLGRHQPPQPPQNEELNQEEETESAIEIRTTSTEGPLNTFSYDTVPEIIQQEKLQDITFHDEPKYPWDSQNKEDENEHEFILLNRKRRGIKSFFSAIKSSRYSSSRKNNQHQNSNQNQKTPSRAQTSTTPKPNDIFGLGDGFGCHSCGR